jgi:hypothetical protein
LLVLAGFAAVSLAPRATATDAGATDSLPDLSPLNPLSGWDEPWVERSRSTPDMDLLRVSTNFVEQEARFDFVWADLRGNPKLADRVLLDGVIAVALSRRLMLGVVADEVWERGPGAAPLDGAGVAALVRTQLIDLKGSSFSLQFKVSAPNRPVGVTQTDLQTVFSGWENLGAGFGLYYSIAWDSWQGPHPLGVRTNDFIDVLSVARTWIGPATRGVGNLTTFLELSSLLEIDGSSAGNSVLSLTPGLRFWLFPKNSLMAGVDLPLSASAAYNIVYRVAYLFSF